MKLQLNTPVVLIKTYHCPHMMGSIGTVVGFIEDRVMVNFPDHIDPQDDTTIWYCTPQQLKPHYNGNIIISTWDTCVWQPKEISQTC